MLVHKQIFAATLTLLSMSLAVAAPPAVHPATGEPLVITCYRGAPVALDGDLSDWNLDAMTPAVLNDAKQIYTGTWTGVADCSGKFYLMWDDQKVYIGAEVKDDRLSMTKSGGDIWNADCIEVFFSTLNAVSGHAEHYQYGFNANNQTYNWCNMDGTSNVVPAYLQIASSKTPDGYVCEVAIEYAQMKSLKFTAGAAIGFHPCIDDTEATDREIQMTWTGREAHDQSLGFGHLILSSEPAIAAGLSRAPNPANKAKGVSVDTAFSWTAGDFAASHDVYLGEVFEDVDNATRTDPKGVLVSQSQTATEYAPATALEYGKVYYWRVDEVNAAPDSTIYKGDVWSFTAESYAYPITSVTAKASGFAPGMGPENTINRAGLDEFDQHDTEATHMWTSTATKPRWIQYEFDQPYKVHELWVWNSNQIIESVVGFGAKDVTIEYSTDGVTWTPLEGAHQFARASGLPTYTANTVVDFGGITAKFVKLTVDTNWGGLAQQVGIAEVRFFYVPVQAHLPSPADGATDVALTASLDWRPGRLATSHKVFFGTDEAAVAAGTAAASTVSTHGYTPPSMTFGTKYFWRVDEVGAAGTDEGDVWSFSAQEFASIDDFEGYTDDEGNRIYEYWLDGVADAVYGGSMVGYMEAPFAERVIIRGGRQSMPLAYDNTKAPYFSEAVREFDSVQNWTGSGAAELCVWTRGTVTEAGLAPMYVIVTDSTGKSATVTGDTAAVASNWTAWKIPMSSFSGVNFSRIKKIAIGVGAKGAASGGSGVVFIDDIGYGRSAQ
ncbi:MAG TPA: sugar-binding protein [Sedimentisphaerales bacterium]|nr:sugar-binding protein [Sedimentisphaerales bacterium]